jgi:hypothetical protein
MVLTRATHGVTNQKTPFFTVTAVKTSNLTSYFIPVARQPLYSWQHKIHEKQKL